MSKLWFALGIFIVGVVGILVCVHFELYLLAVGIGISDGIAIYFAIR
jgi:hypothetical protein